MAMGTAGWGRSARAALVASLGAGLGACLQTEVPPPPLPKPAIAAPQATAQPFPPHPGHKPPRPVLSSLPPQQRAPRDLASLQGIDQDAAIAMLGQPDLRSEASPAVLWRYSKGGCQLDLYFYLDLQSRQMRVLHYDVRVTDGSDRSQQGCYGELVSHRADEAGSADRPR